MQVLVGVLMMMSSVAVAVAVERETKGQRVKRRETTSRLGAGEARRGARGEDPRTEREQRERLEAGREGERLDLVITIQTNVYNIGGVGIRKQYLISNTN